MSEANRGGRAIVGLAVLLLLGMASASAAALTCTPMLSDVTVPAGLEMPMWAGILLMGVKFGLEHRERQAVRKRLQNSDEERSGELRMRYDAGQSPLCYQHTQDIALLGQKIEAGFESVRMEIRASRVHKENEKCEA